MDGRLVAAAWLFVILMIPTASTSTTSTSTPRNRKLRHSPVEVQEVLKRLNKPPVKSIQSPDGDIIDCILIHQQPAFDHPLLKDHVIQMRPSSEPHGIEESGSETNEVVQLWQTTNETCPDGTVPIRRTKEEDLLRADSLQDFGKNKFPSSTPTNYPRKTHEYAAIMVGPGKFYGGQASINLWSPQVVLGDFSLAQMWVAAGSYQLKNLNTVEAGSHIFPSMYGDSRPRFFTYWTGSTYDGSTGCYNLLCPGFVQVTRRFSVGVTVIDPLSSYGGQQYDFTVRVWKDKIGNKWWLRVKDVDVGYWAAELFKTLGDFADDVHFGGEVLNSAANGRHTDTQMGSGHFAEEKFGKAAYFKNMKIVDSSNNVVDPPSVEPVATNPHCYSVMNGFTAEEAGNYFYYGGPGRNPNCP